MVTILFLVVYLWILVGSALPLTVLMGKVLKWRGKYFVIFAGGTALPIALILYGLWLIHIARAGQGPSDINGLNAFFLMLLPLLMLPFSIIVAARAFRKYAPDVGSVPKG